jgi:hypothetical protein
MDTTAASGTTDKAITRGLFVGLALIVAFCAIGSFAFFAIWAEGDGKAQAFAGFLAFVAACVSAAVTIAYVSLTYSSLRKAQESINLQQEQLKQMRSSIKLQREEWDQKVRVHPQFWMTSCDQALWYRPDPQRPGGIYVQTLPFSKKLAIDVWNYSEQSFLVESVRLTKIGRRHGAKSTIERSSSCREAALGEPRRRIFRSYAIADTNSAAQPRPEIVVQRPR